MNAQRSEPTNADLRVEIAVIKRDIQELDRKASRDRKDLDDKITAITEDLKAIRGYFFKFILGIASIVGGYVVKWLLSGGLAGFGG